MYKNMMTNCPTRLHQFFAFLLLFAASPLLAQEDCDNIVTIPELATQVQEWQDAHDAVQVDTIIRLSEGTYEVHLSNGATYTKVLGCTDPAYTEYNAAANTDDGSCATLASSCSEVEMDGYTYAAVEIGDQCWFAENLRTAVYADGASIPEVTGNTAWAGLTSGARCDYNNNASNVATYGRLYNWYAVDDARSLCPSGWHVPTDGEWMELQGYLISQGFSGNEGVALKSTTGWTGGNGTDDYGFSALPGGYRNDYEGQFYNVGFFGNWWSSSPSGSNAWYRNLYYNFTFINRSTYDPHYGLSVRCLRDAE